MPAVGQFYDLAHEYLTGPELEWNNVRVHPQRVFRILFPGLFWLLDREQSATFHL